MLDYALHSLFIALMHKTPNKIKKLTSHLAWASLCKEGKKRTNKQTNKPTDGRTDGRTDGGTDGPTDGRTDGQTDRQTEREREPESQRARGPERQTTENRTFTVESTRNA